MVKQKKATNKGGVMKRTRPKQLPDPTVDTAKDVLAAKKAVTTTQKPAKVNKAPAKSFNHKGSMAEFMDHLLCLGGTWENLGEGLQAEAERRKLDAKHYSAASLRSHAKYRERTGHLTLVVTDKNVTAKRKEK